MTHWRDPAVVTAENCSFILLALEDSESLLMLPCLTVALIKLMHVLGGVYM